MKNYWITFGSDNPMSFTGLSPSFILFFNQLGATVAPPGITEIYAGSGAYRFQYNVGFSTSIFFLVDGGATLSLANRYARGVLDNNDNNDLRIGYSASSFGDTSVDPGTLYGFLKRAQEFQEGNATFLKSSGAWSLYSRGSSTLLTTKILTNNTTGTTKT